MKKLLFVLMAAFTIGGNAQNIIQWEGFAGFNVSNIGGLGSKPGFHIGAKAELGIPSIANGVYVNAGAVFSMKGCKQDYGDLGGAKTKANFLDIPIHMGYRYNINNDFSIFGEVGPYFSFGLFGKTKTEELDSDGFGDWSMTEYSYNTFGKDGLKRFDVGAGLRFGVELKHKYSLAIGYDWGFIDLYNQMGIDESGEYEDGTSFDLTPKMKTKNLTISIGYKF